MSLITLRRDAIYGVSTVHFGGKNLFQWLRMPNKCERTYFFVFIFLLFSSLVSAQENMTSNATVKPFRPFIVYQDKGDLTPFVPSGYMPNGECIKMNDAWKESCHEGRSCIKVIYDVACSARSRRWAGVYWLHPADNWGDRKGGYNLTGAHKLVFWAKGEEGGEKIAEFRVGGVGGGRDYPDSDTASIGPVILSKHWKEYEINLRDKDLSFISGGFAWIANVDDNPTSCVFYLDHIRYE